MAGRTDLDDHQEAPPTASERPSRRGVPAPQADQRRPGAAEAALKPGELRTVLSHLRRPLFLDTPQIRHLLAAHCRLPPHPSPTTVGAAAVALFTDAIAALDPGPDAPNPQRLPFLVLEASFLRRRKLVQAAPELGLSERQLSRERSRALALLAAELAATPGATVDPHPLPAVNGHVRRGPALRRLADAATAHRLVGVTGEAGAGKTSLVAALALALGPHVWWERIRPGVNDSLEAVLHDLAGALALEGLPELQDNLAAALPKPDPTTATRVALHGLGASPWRLLVLDDFGGVRQPQQLGAFLEEVVERLPNVSVVTIGAALTGGTVVEVPPLSPVETVELFGEVDASRPDLAGIHELSGGNARMLGAVAAWRRGEERGLGALERHLQARGPLANLVDLLAFTHRGAA